MNQRQLEVFLIIAKTQNIKQASEQLFITPSAVSKTLGELEKEVGLQVFDRIKGRLYLNEEGRLFAEKASQLLEDLERMTTLFTSTEELPIRVGASITFGESLLTPAIVNFKKQHPKTPVPVTIGNVGVIREKLLANELDLAIIEGPAFHEAFISVPISTFNIYPVGVEKYFPKKTISLEKLSTYPLLVRETGSSLRKAIEEAFVSSGLGFNFHWESRSTESLILACEAGLGVTFLPETYLPLKKNLTAVKIKQHPLKSHNHLIYLKNKSQRKEFQNFITVMKNSFANTKNP